jgi:hypothetical protein
VEGDDAGEPERDVGEIFSEKFFSFGARFLPFGAVHFQANLIGERVHARAAAVSAVGATGRERFEEKKS